MYRSIKTNPLVYLFGKMWRYAGDNRRNISLYIALFVIANAAISLEPIIVGFLFNAIQSQGVHASNVLHLIFLLSLLILEELSIWIFFGPARTIENRNAFKVKANYKNYLLEGVLALPMEWHTDHHSGDTIDKIEKGSDALYNFSSKTFGILQAGIQLLISVAVLIFFDHLAGIVALLLTIPAFYISIRLDRILVPGYAVVNRMENGISAKVFDTISNITTVVILRAQHLVRKSLNESIYTPYRQYDKNSIVNEIKWFGTSIMGRITVVVVISIYLFTHAAAGTILIGTVYILYGYANQIRNTFFQFTGLYNDIVRYRASVSNSEELSKDFEPIDRSDIDSLPVEWKELDIKNMSFSYRGSENRYSHLEHINMTIRHGERIALIGDSGGGKSTYLKVLRNLYRPRDFDLVLDGKKIISGFAAISNSISLVPQDPEIFSTTIRDNITLGVEYPEMHIQVFSKMAQFDSVLARLPHGLDSYITEKGVNLSGGEKQRLALTRGLLASVGKDITLLDEPTSSVDSANELKIYQNIFESFPKTTIISSIHRLHLLTLFDSIYFLRNGTIITHGTFEELLATSADFQYLWSRYMKTKEITS